MNCTSPSGRCGQRPWYELPECVVAPYAFVFYFVVKILNLGVGTPCNILVLWQIASKKRDASTSDIFIFNLAILDAYFCLMTPIEVTNRLLLDDSGVWYFQRFAYGIKDVAPLFLCRTSQYFFFSAVPDVYLFRSVHGCGPPVLFTTIRDKIRIFISVVMWALILAHGLVKSILGVMSVNEVFSSVIIIAVILMIFCNISVIWVLRRSVMGKEEMHPVKKKALKMVLITLAIILVNYLPVALMPFVTFYSFVVFQCQIAISVFSIMDLSCTIEPLLYISKMEHVNGKCCSCRLTKKQNDAKV
ncbi:hypothetical protein Q5P01_025585 [Channa striata]|uniref:G-protein coupled receptors family 1 profile domain-containing protein n=1 Tax=Channa striata TaxID=64152 RepID=A0AA88LIB5_CHASR|nr:hypothetical protein Q5P01_025585 [Channa striata]